MYGTGLVSVVSGPAVPSSHLESGDALELHHLQHLLGLSINLDDVLGAKTGHIQLHRQTSGPWQEEPLWPSLCRWAKFSL